MTFSWGRTGAIFRKELRDHRRNRFVIMTMAFLPIVFVIAPTIQLLRINASFSSSQLDTRLGLSLLYMLIIPAMVPSALAVAYLIFGIFLGIAAIFAQPGVASAVFEPAHLLVQLLFTPLLAGWSIWVGIATSARSADVRTAQQLGTLASLPPLAIVALMAFSVITPTLGLAFGLAAGLLIVDVLGWRAVAAMFDRERLVTGTRS
jgi:hypothetical protein